MAGSVNVGGPEGIAPSTPTPFAPRSNSATMTVSSTRATNAPGIFGVYRFINRTIRNAEIPMANDHRLVSGIASNRATNSTK